MADLFNGLQLVFSLFLESSVAIFVNPSVGIEPRIVFVFSELVQNEVSKS